MITSSELKAALVYEPETGNFAWAKTRKKCPAGKLAGSIRNDGYVTIRVNGHRYYAHRLAWLFMCEEWPNKSIDHADGDPSNNRWENLRAATPSQQLQNRGRQKNNTVGVKGVKRSSSGYYSMIQIDGASKYLGSFETSDAAHAAYCNAASKAFGEFARFN